MRFLLAKAEAKRPAIYFLMLMIQLGIGITPVCMKCSKMHNFMVPGDNSAVGAVVFKTELRAKGHIIFIKSLLS
jgi:hypothetical protein